MHFTDSDAPARMLLRLAGFDSIREGLHAVMLDIRALLEMAMQQAREKPS